MNLRRYKPLWGLLIILMVFTLLYQFGHEREKPDRVPWQTNLPGARKEAGKAGKLIFVDFTASWCEPCQKLKQTLWNDPEVAAAIAARFVPVKIDVDAQGEIASRFVREGIPAFAILAPDGTEQKFRDGYLTKEDFMKWIDSVPSGSSSVSAAN